MADSELTQLADELTLREMLIAGLLDREGETGWNVSEKGWEYMTMLMGLAGIDMKDADPRSGTRVRRGQNRFHAQRFKPAVAPRATD
jgi:hypothetical protein